MHRAAGRRQGFWAHYGMETCYLLLVVVSLVRTIPANEWFPTEWYSYILNYYALSYQTVGRFVARGLLGTATQLFCPMIRVKVFYIVFWCIYLGFYALLGLVPIRAIKKTADPGFGFLLLCLCVFNPAVLNYAVDFARPDLFMALLFLLSMHLLYTGRALWLLPVLTAAAMLIHEGYLVIFLPTVATVLLQRCLQKRRRRDLAVFGILCAASLALLAGILLYGKNCIGDVAALHLAAQSKVDVPLNPNMIDFEQGPLSGQLKEVSLRTLTYFKTPVVLCLYALLFLPLFLGFVRVMRRSADRSENRFLFLLSVAAPLSGLAMTLAGVDYGRWFSMAVTCCLVRGYSCACRSGYDWKRLLGRQAGTWSGLSMLTLLVCYVTIGTMGDIYQHCDYLVKLNSLYHLLAG